MTVIKRIFYLILALFCFNKEKYVYLDLILVLTLRLQKINLNTFHPKMNSLNLSKVVTPIFVAVKIQGVILEGIF